MTKQTRERWAERVREWRASGLSAEEFTAAKDYAASSLRWAAAQVQGGPKTPAPATSSGVKPARGQRRPERPAWPGGRAPRFVPVRMRPSAPVLTELVVEVGAARVRVTRGADLGLVGDVVRALQGVAR